jgi:hypothetical protein
MQTAQLRTGIDTQLGRQHAASLLVDSERLGPPPAPGQGEHELTMKVFSQRMARGQLLQLGDQLLVTAFVQISLDAAGQRLYVQLLQDRHPLIPQQLGRYIHQRRTPPQPQRARRDPRGIRPPAGVNRVVGLPRQRLEPAGVQFVTGHLDRVAGGSRHDPGRGLLVQPPPQSHDQGTDCFWGSAGRCAVPHQIRQLVDRDRLVRPPQQHRKNGPQPGRRDHLWSV